MAVTKPASERLTGMGYGSKPKGLRKTLENIADKITVPTRKLEARDEAIQEGTEPPRIPGVDGRPRRGRNKEM